MQKMSDNLLVRGCP